MKTSRGAYLTGHYLFAALKERCRFPPLLFVESVPVKMLLVTETIDSLARFAEVVMSTAIVVVFSAGTELVKQLRLSQHAYPQRRNPLYKFIEIALFRVSPLYAKSSQNECSNVMGVQQQQFISAATDIVNICKGERTFKRR